MIFLLGILIAAYGASIIALLDVFTNFKNQTLGIFCWFLWIILLPMAFFQICFYFEW